MTEANAQTRQQTKRQKILLDVFHIFADHELDVPTATQLVLMDKIVTYCEQRYSEGFLNGVANAEKQDRTE